ncbi:hypothetical protein [Serratia nevei]|uniref:hypothetical protein n=1 Tax=Serratia nevei TaxID=2703794 RepID=UPI003FA7E784
MSVPNQTPYNIYTANGLTTIFPYEFYLLNEGDLAVSLNGSVITSGYTISGVGNVDGGEVLFLTPPANGVTIMLERVIPTYRLTDYQDNGDMLADTVNKDFDRLWMAIQQAFIYLGLALTRPLLGGPFNAKGYRIENLGYPLNRTDAASKQYVDDTGAASLSRTLRVPEPSVNMLRPVAVRNKSLLGFNDLGQPVPIFSMTDTADLAIRLASSTGANLVGWHDTTVGDYLDHLALLVAHTSPEAHGAVGDGITDDTAAWTAALAMNVHVICDPRKNYRVTAPVYRKYSDVKISIDGRGCRMSIDHKDHAFLTDASNTPNPSLYDPLGIYNTEFRNITAWNSATRMSRYGDVMRSTFARPFNGSVYGCDFTGFCDVVVLLGRSSYFDNYTTDCRDNALVIFGDDNRGGPVVGGVTGGDSVLCKSNNSVFSDISFVESGVLPLGHPDGDNTPGGSPLAFAQDGDNAIGNIFGNVRCQRHGSGGVIMNGENNYVHSIDVGSFVDASRTHLPAGGAWVVYMSGKNNKIGDVKADYYHNGVQMHDKSEGCHIGNSTLQRKSPYGQFTLVASGTQKNCSIGKVSAFENVNKNDEIYIAMPDIIIDGIEIRNFNSTYVAGQYVGRILSKCYIREIYISSAGDATHTRTALLLGANATIKRIHEDNIIAIGVEVATGASPRLGDVVVNQNTTLGTNNPVILRGSTSSESREFSSMRVTGGAPRIEGGTLNIGSYLGQRWQGNAAATVNYPDLQPHTPNT